MSHLTPPTLVTVHGATNRDGAALTMASDAPSGTRRLVVAGLGLQHGIAMAEHGRAPLAPASPVARLLSA